MLKEKVAIVTGASRGLGKATALDMAKNGANVAIIYAGNKEKAEEVKNEAISYGVKANIYKCDVSNFDEVALCVKNIVADFGKVDILVNNAGITKDSLVLSMSEEDFSTVVDTNLKGTFNMIKQVYS